MAVQYPFAVESLTMLYYRKKLKGKEQDVINLVRSVGVDATMALFGCKSRAHFAKFLRSNIPDAINFHPSEVVHLRGGTKAKWLRLNREFVIECVEMWGRDFAMVNFALKPETLDETLRFQRGRLTQLEREGRATVTMDGISGQEIRIQQEHQHLEIEVCKQQIRDTQREVDELKELYGKFVRSVSERIGNAILMPLIERAARPKQILKLKPKESVLSLADMPPPMLAEGQDEIDPREGQE